MSAYGPKRRVAHNNNAIYFQHSAAKGREVLNTVQSWHTQSQESAALQAGNSCQGGACGWRALTQHDIK